MTSASTPATTSRTGTSLLSAWKRPTITRTQLWILAAGLLAALVVFAGYLLLVSPQRDQASRLHAQAASETAQADALQRQVATLTAQSKDMPKYRAALAAAQNALPSTAALPAFLRQLQDISTRTDVAVTAMSATPPVAVDVDGNVLDPDSLDESTAAADLLYRTTLTVTATSGSEQLSAYLLLFQNELPRAVLVTNLALSAGAGENDLPSVTMTMNAFFAPGDGTSVSADSSPAK